MYKKMRNMEIEKIIERLQLMCEQVRDKRNFSIDTYVLSLCAFCVIILFFSACCTGEVSLRPAMSLQPRGSSSVSEKDFDSLIQKNLPTWNATWNMLLQANLESSRVEGRPETTELHERIRRKITELVDKEEALVDLYRKAAEAAKEREITFRNKTAILTEQIKKDKNLMKILKRS